MREWEETRNRNVIDSMQVFMFCNWMSVCPALPFPAPSSGVEHGWWIFIWGRQIQWGGLNGTKTHNLATRTSTHWVFVCVCDNSFRYIPSASIYCFLFFFFFFFSESFHPMFHACKGIGRKAAQNLAFLSASRQVCIDRWSRRDGVERSGAGWDGGCGGQCWGWDMEMRA